MRNWFSYAGIMILLLYTAHQAIAQPDLSPWTAKFVVTHPNGVDSDTVWFGADTAGGPGYQLGLDVIDTNFSGRIKILAYDEQVEADSGFGTCVNLKQDIRGFWDWGFKTFTFYIYSDTLGAGGEMVAIDYDSLDWFFLNDSFKIKSAFVEVTYGYANVVDKTDFGIIHTFNNQLQWSPGPDLLISELPAFECDPSVNVIKLDLWVCFNSFFPPNGLSKAENIKRLAIYPNPASSIVRFDIPNAFKSGGSLRIYNLLGNVVFDDHLNGSFSGYIDVSGFRKGTYIVILIDHKHSVYYKGHFIKS